MERESAKTADMNEKGADPYDLKQQVVETVISFVVVISLEIPTSLSKKSCMLKPRQMWSGGKKCSSWFFRFLKWFNHADIYLILLTLLHFFFFL